MVQSHWFCLFQVCLNFWIHVMFLIYLLTYLSIYFLIGVHVRMLCLVSPGLLSFLSYLFSIFRSLLTSVNKEARTVGLSTFVLWDLHYRTSFKLWIEQLFFSELCWAGHIQFGLIMFLWNSESSELRCPIESLASSLQVLSLQPVSHNFKPHSHNPDPPCLAPIPLQYFEIEGYKVQGQCKMTLKE